MPSQFYVFPITMLFIFYESKEPSVFFMYHIYLREQKGHSWRSILSKLGSGEGRRVGRSRTELSPSQTGTNAQCYRTILFFRPLPLLARALGYPQTKTGTEPVVGQYYHPQLHKGRYHRQGRVELLTLHAYMIKWPFGHVILLHKLPHWFLDYI